MADNPQDDFKIRLTVAGTVYPLGISRSDEEIYRRAEREVNSWVETYKKRFRAESEQYLAMAALQIAVRNVRMDLERSSDDQLDQLKQIEAKLDNYLAEK